MNADDRIAIIGAGAAGLSAATFLQQRGYTQVQVLETDERVGGKCHSVTADGRSFDLGAFTLTPGYKQTLKLAKAVSVPLIRQPERKVFDISKPWVGSARKGLRRKHGLLTLLTSSARYLWVLWRYRRWLAVPGFAGLKEHPELIQPFSEWAGERKLDALITMFRLTVKDMGYGSMDEIPTVYILKYLNGWNFIILALYTVGLRSWPKRMRFGFERLWEAVALPLDVQTGVQITAIRREATGIQIDVAGESQARNYDYLITSCMPDQLQGVMDFGSEEKDLFSRICTTRYSSTLARVDNMPAEVYNAIDDGIGQDHRQGHPWEMMRAWPDNDHATFYAMLDDTNDLQAIQAHIVTDLDKLFRARLLEIVEQREWAYFPHVSLSDMQAGYFDRLEGLQGLRRSFYTGGLLAFETVENVVAYSHQLISDHFPAQAKG